MKRIRLAGVAIAALAALMLLVAAPGAATAKQHRSLKVTCDQLRNQVAQTGARLETQFNAMGFKIESQADIDYNTLLGYSAIPIDGWYAYKTCQGLGKRHFKGGGVTNVLQGGGYIYDLLSPGEPPFPGETNPAIRSYYWTWSETVTRNRKGRLLDTVNPPSCSKHSFDGNPYDPQNQQTYPC